VVRTTTLVDIQQEIHAKVVFDMLMKVKTCRVYFVSGDAIDNVIVVFFD